MKQLPLICMQISNISLASLSHSTSTQNPLWGGAGSVPTLMAPQLALLPSPEPSPLGYPVAQWSHFRVLCSCWSDLEKQVNQQCETILQKSTKLFNSSLTSIRLVGPAPLPHALILRIRQSDGKVSLLSRGGCKISLGILSAFSGKAIHAYFS